MNVPLTIAALLSAIAGTIALVVAKRTGAARTDWFRGHPGLVPVFEKIYWWLGIAGLVLALLLIVLAFASGTLSAFSG